MNAEAKELLASLRSDARSDEPARHEELLARLQSPDVLAILDSEADYQNATKFRLRVAQVAEALARNPSASAIEAFLGLTTSEIFLAHDERITALLRASAHLRPAPPGLVAFWDRYCQMDDSFSPTTVGVLLDNGSPLAIELFERKMLDPSHDDNSKTGWLRSDVLEHRNDLPLLQACGRLLPEGLSESVQLLLVDVLFDYLPEEWFKPATSRSPPPLASATDDALDQVIKNAIRALTMVPLSDEKRRVIRERMQEAEDLKVQP